MPMCVGCMNCQVLKAHVRKSCFFLYFYTCAQGRQAVGNNPLLTALTVRRQDRPLQGKRRTTIFRD